MPAPFPEPSSDARASSDALVGVVRRAIESAGGWLGFERFMELALYEPGLGYYSSGSVKLGAGGDFTTAPELGDWLAEALAAFISDALAKSRTRRVLELGAGRGSLADSLLDEFDRRGLAGIDYAILEPSADLRARQQTRLAEKASRVRWLDRLPEAGFDALVLANEVADALPVARFLKVDGDVRPLGVVARDGRLDIVTGEPDDRLREAVAGIEAELGRPLADGYRSEFCLLLAPWIRSLLETAGTGGVLLIDYGLPRRDYYRPERRDGTLICHYRQRAHSDPLLWPGLQDISAWVDFSLVADTARRSGHEVGGFTTQGQFLVESLAASRRLESLDAADAAMLRTLVLPGEMGERFKLIWLPASARSPGLPGRDFRNWL